MTPTLKFQILTELDQSPNKMQFLQDLNEIIHKHGNALNGLNSTIFAEVVDEQFSSPPDVI